MYVPTRRLSCTHTHTHTPVSLSGRKVEFSVHGDLTALWPHYYSEPAVRRRVLLRSQYSSPPALVDDVHGWGGCCAGSSFPWTASPTTVTHTHTHTHSLPPGRYAASAFCQGVLSQGPLGPLAWWESGLLAPWMPPSLQMRGKTRPEKDTAAHPLLSFPIFPLLSLSYTHALFPSSLSSAQAVDSVNWLTQSPVHWLRSLIKGLLIGTLFNTGPCSESCPLILSWQQPFPVCQSLNVINYVSRLRRYFFRHVFGPSPGGRF